MTLLMALVYFLAGILCIHRPALLVEWIGNALKRTGNAKAPEWLGGRGIIMFIRLIGFLAMLNAIVLFYTAFYRHG
jgi:hypothetical protein